MEFSEGLPFLEALDRLGQRGVVASDFDSFMWRQVAVEVRERAFFSSRVESGRLLDAMKGYVGDYLAEARDGEGRLKAQGRSEFVAEMRELAMREGLGRVDPETGEISPEIRETDLEDIRSIARLQLVFDTQVEAAQEYGFWAQGMEPAVLRAFPAARFIRVRPVMVPRAIHAANEGEVRRKDDMEFWLAMNEDFGVPWGPWGFNSGMGVEDVGRREAMRLGLVTPDAPVEPVRRRFNEGLEAGVKGMDEEIAAELARATGGTVAEGKVLPAVESQTVEDLLQIAQVARDGDLTKDQAVAMLEELKETLPVLGMSKVKEIKGAKKKGVLTKTFVEKTINDFAEFLPKKLASALPEFRVVVKASMRRAGGSYNQDAKELLLSVRALKSEEEARATIMHELLHWVHDHGGAEVDLLVRGVWDARTAGEATAKLLPWNRKDIVGRRDKWADADGSEYAGRIYPWEQKRYGGPKGHEVLTMHLEKLASADSLVRHWNHAASDGSHAWRDAFLKLLEVFYE